MDFHFTIPEDTSPSNSRSGPKFGMLFKRLTPLFVLSAVLPLFLFFVSSPADLKFLTRADRAAELRVWLEPANIVAHPNDTIELKVFANFESDTKLLPGITLTATSVGIPVVGEITYLRPFNGKVELGTITATPSLIGMYEIIIPEESIQVTAFDDPLLIKTSTAKLFIQ